MWHPFSSRARSAAKPSRRAHGRRAARPRLESLEGRVVLSTVAFDSVLGVGNDTASILPWDNAVDRAGNTYVTGLVYGTMDLDPNVDHADGSDILTVKGSSDVFVAKYAPDNSLIWARRMGSDNVYDVSAGSYLEEGKSIAVDGDGNVYVSGRFQDQADFGPFTLTSAGSGDAFVTKLDSGGNVLWAKSWGGAGMDISNGIAVDAAGNVVSVGTTSTVYSNGFSQNGFEVHKYSPTGAAVWSKRYDNYGGEATGVATDAAGNIYLCGEFRGTMDFTPELHKATYVSGGSSSNGYVLKLSASGAFGWVSPFVANTAASPGAYSYCTDIALDTAGNVVVVGQYVGQVDFDPSSRGVRQLPNIGASYDGFVVKLSPRGALTWATPLGGAHPNSLAVDASGAVYAAGTFSSTFTPGFGLPPVTSNGQGDVFVAKLTAAGSVDWAVTFGGTGGDLGTGIAVDASGTVYVTGTFRYTVDFDPDAVGIYELSNAAYADMFLLKLRQE